jgi:hypothetical protein
MTETPAARTPSAIVHVGRPGGVEATAPQSLYLFADLGAPSADLARRPGTYLVTAFDMDQRIATVGELQRRHPGLADSPRLAGAALELDRALSLVTDALTRIGRRVTSRAVCDDVRSAANADRHYSILDLSNGTVVNSTDMR